MKKTLTFVILLLLTLTVRAQLPIGMPVPYPPSLNGTMMPIQFPAMTPAIPDSLTPVMINHIGRHGARYLTSENKTARLRRAVEESRTPASSCCFCLTASTELRPANGECSIHSAETKKRR